MKCWKVDTSYSQHEHEVRIVSLAVQVTRVHAIQPLAYEQHPPLLLEALSAQQTNPLLMLLLHPLDNPIHVLVLNHTTRLLEDWDSNYPHLRIAAILNTYQLPTDDVATFKRVLVVVWNIHSHAYSLWILVLRNDATYGDVGIDLDVPKTAEFILQSILNDERTFSPSDRPVSCWMECIWSQNEANEGPLDDVDLMEYVTT
ncbi:hypothetical protein BC830DRAFT_523418 [Chytriomyces sp. MP71]|nr:hypothetical protein BC830DRAFT_523418 [Chytriomyces sp. MP71]